MTNMLNTGVLATIITFNPNISQLFENVQRIMSQVDDLVIYDNCSKNIEEIKGKLSDVHIIQNDTNLGLPINYNRAVSLAKEKGYKWLLIMDQDTLIPDNLIEEYRKYMSLDNVAIICPRYRDINCISEEEFNKRIPDEPYNFVDRCISSASLNNVDIATEIGGFDEKMFIDYVDYDYCKNCINHGYKILEINTCVVEHQIGKSKIINFLGRKLVSYNHPPIRKYYFFRNRVYYARKYHENIIRVVKSLLGHFIPLFYEENKSEKIKQALKGLIDGLKL